MGQRIKSRAGEWAQKKKEVDEERPEYMFKVGEATPPTWRTFGVGREGILTLDGQDFMDADKVLEFRDWLNATFDEQPTPAPTDPSNGNGSTKP